MIINADRSPIFSLYYLGYIVILILQQEDSLCFEEIFKKTKEKLAYNLPVIFLYYALDWLFLISVIKNENGLVILCK